MFEESQYTKKPEAQIIRLPRPGVVWGLSLGVLLVAVAFIVWAYGAAGSHFNTIEQATLYSTIVTAVVVLLVLLNFPTGHGWVRVPLAILVVLDVMWPVIWTEYDAFKYPRDTKPDISSAMTMNIILGVIGMGIIASTYAIPVVREWLAAERRWRKVVKPSLFMSR